MIAGTESASRFLRVSGLALAAAAGFIGCSGGQQPADPLRTIAAVRNLPESAMASGRRVALHGVVTVLDPGWRLLVIQDETGGVLVDWPALERPLQTGDRVEVDGATSIDNHVPSIVSAAVRVAGSAPRPVPETVSIEALACAPEEILYRVVQVEIVPDEGSFGDGTHTVGFTAHHPCDGVAVIGRLLRQSSPASLTGHRLRIRGVPLASYSPAGRLDQVRLIFDDESNVDVLDPPAPEPPRAVASTLPELTSVSDIKSLPRSEAMRGYPVRVEGIVTAPVNPRHDGYFIQQGSTGICVFAARGNVPALQPGQRIRVTGRTEQGGFAPVIRQQSLEVTGVAPLPAPAKVEPGDVFHGSEENQWVEVEGLGTAVINDAGHHQLELFAGPKRILLWFSEEHSPERLAALVDARLAVQGVYAPVYTISGGLTGFRMFVPSIAMVRVIETAPAAPASRTIASLSQFDLRGVPRHKFRTSGTVTYRDSRGGVYLQDGNAALQVVGTGVGDPPLNSRASVEGFLSPETGPPRIEHIRWLGHTAGEALPPRQALAESLVSGELQGRLVTVEGFLEGRRTSGGELQLDLIAGRSRLAGFLEAPGSQQSFLELRPGALLRLTGVATTQAGPAFTAAGGVANVWLRTPDDIAIVRGAPFWDQQRALYAAAGAALSLILMLAWVAALRHKVVGQMAVRSKLEAQLLHSQKLESVGRLAGGVAHDFNNYLTVVIGYTSLLLEQFPQPGPIRTQLNTIKDVGEKTASLTRQLLAFSRRQVLQPVSCDVNEIIGDAKATLLPLIGEHIDIEMRLAHVDRVIIDPDQFLQVLVNLAVNARDAMPEGGTLTFETASRSMTAADVPSEYGMRPGQYVCVSVTDTGTGMDRTTRERIFEPFFTTKEAGRGTGLGLAVVFGIVKQSNGHILVDSETGRGTRFRIYLPVAVDDVRGERPAAPSGDLNGSETILVVEDDGSVRHLVCTALERHGYKVISAVGPAEALAVLEDLDVAVDLLVTDLVMPEMSGPLLAAQAALKRPALRVLYVSGYSEEYVESAAGQGIDCLEKPFTSERLAGAVRRVLDSNEPSAIPVGSQATHARQQSPVD